MSRSSCSVTRMMSMRSLLLTIFTSFLPLVYHEAGRRAREEVNTVMGDIELTTAMKDFCLRVLRGGCSPQETAVLPDVLSLVLDMDNEAEK